jgi:hypothetical protein
MTLDLTRGTAQLLTTHSRSAASDTAGHITGTLIDISAGEVAARVPRAAHETAAADGDNEFRTEKWNARA